MSPSARVPALTSASLALSAIGVALARLSDLAPARAAGLLLAGAGLFLLAHALRTRAVVRAEQRGMDAPLAPALEREPSLTHRQAAEGRGTFKP